MYGRGKKSSSSPRIGGAQWVTTVESTLWGAEEHGAGRGGCPGSRPVVAPAEGTVPCT